MIEIIRTTRKELGIINIPRYTKLYIDIKKQVKFGSSLQIQLIAGKAIENEINTILSKYPLVSNLAVERSHIAHDDCETWKITGEVKEHTIINNFADGLAELIKEFPPIEDSTSL